MADVKNIKDNPKKQTDRVLTEDEIKSSFASTSPDMGWVKEWMEQGKGNIQTILMGEAMMKSTMPVLKRLCSMRAELAGHFFRELIKEGLDPDQAFQILIESNLTND